MAAGSIVFDLLMRTASFETDTKRAEKRLKEFRKEAEAMGQAFGMAVAGGAAVATYALKESIDAMDEASKAAQKVGVTTEAFTGLAHAAKLADLDTSELTKTLVKLSNEASTGNDAFAAMGIKVKDSTGHLKSADVLLGEVADKFAEYGDEAEKTALAVALFGEKIGPKLIPLLNGGSKGLREMTDEARALGLVIDTETGKAAEAFNDNLTRLGGAAKGFANTAAAELLPLLGSISDEMVKGAKDGGGYAEVFGGALKVALQTVIVLGSDVAFVFKGIGTEIGGMAAQMAALMRFDFEGFSFVGDAMKKDAAAARAELDAFQARIMGLGSTPAAAATASGGGKTAPHVETAEEAAARAKAAAARAKAAADAKREAERLAKLGDGGLSAKEIMDQLHAEDQAIESLRQKYVDMADPLQKYRDQLNEINTLRANGVLTADQAIEAEWAVNDAMDATIDKMVDIKDEGKDAFAELATAIDGFGKDAAGAFVDFALTGKSSFSDMTKSIIADIAKMLIYKNVTGPLATAISGAFTANADGGVYSSPSLHGYANSVVTSPKLFAFANGVGLMGEAGPEAIMPLRRGADGKLGVQASGGGGVTIINNTGQQVSQREVPDGRGGRKLEVQIGDAVASQMMLPGSMANKARRAPTMVRRG